MRKWFVRIAMINVAISGLIMCATLTPGGKQVQYSMKSDAPAECKQIDEVSINTGMFGAFNPPRSIDALKIDMRNEAAEKGANFLVIETIENKQGLYAGTGRAYKCP